MEIPRHPLRENQRPSVAWHVAFSFLIIFVYELTRHILRRLE